VDIVPHAAGSAAADAGNLLDVRVEQMEYLGAFWRTRVTGARLRDRELVADFSINAVRRLDIEVGSALRIEIPAERLLVFPREA